MPRTYFPGELLFNSVSANALFQAPEVAFQERLEPFAADVYSLASLAHWVLFGRCLVSAPEFWDEAQLLVAKKELPASLDAEGPQLRFFRHFERFLCFEARLRSSEASEFAAALDLFLQTNRF